MKLKDYIPQSIGKRIRRLLDGRRSYTIYCDKTSKVLVGKNVSISDSIMSVSNNSILIIEDHVNISGYSINVHEGYLHIGQGSVLQKIDYYIPKITIEKGHLEINNHCVIKANIQIRFDGRLSIGRYTTINQGTIIRCDDSINIGDFVMISYECLIFDTNTHRKLPSSVRRNQTMGSFPWIGEEFEKPNTAPIIIGDDVWIGQRAVILKGSKVNSKAIVGLSAVVTSDVPAGHLAVGNPARIIKYRLDDTVHE